MLRTRSIASAFAIASLALTTGCATILGGGGSQAVSVRSDPAGATFVVRSSSGLQMSSGTAPQQVTLARKNEYEIEFSMPGYQTQRLSLLKGLNGWVWVNLLGNIFVGGIIDVVSGAAWKLEPSIVDIKLTKAAGRDDYSAANVRMYDKRGRLIGNFDVPMVRTE